MTKNLAYAFLGNIAILVINDRNPSDDEHRECARAFLKQDLAKIRSLTVTAGGAPTPSQRKALNDALNGLEHPSAVVSESPMIRGVVTAFSWFNRKIHAYPPDKFDDALRYLEIPPSEWERVRATVGKLQMEVGSTTLKAASWK